MHTNAHNDEEKRAGRGRRHRHGEEHWWWNANEKKDRKKEIRDTPRRPPKRTTSVARAREKETGLEDATDRDALDKRGDTGLIAAFTLTAHQSRSTASRTSFPFSSSRLVCVFVDM